MKRLAVTVVKRVGVSFIAQWEEKGVRRRALVPAEVLAEDGTVPEEVLCQGVPMSVAWEEAWKPQVKAADVARELQRNHIWTVKDAENRSARFLEAVTRLYQREAIQMLGRLRGGD